MNNILAIESSGLTASVAIMTDGRLAAEYTINNKKTHSQTLLPMIDEIMKNEEMKPADLDCIAISRGPGSFTGLRIGSATAKGLALALGIPIVEVSTLKALAYNLYGNSDSVICPIMDARRQEVYTAAYEFIRTDAEELQITQLIEEKAVPLLQILSELEKLGRKVVFCGDGVPVYKDIINERFMTDHMFAPETLLLQRAASVAALGEKMFLNGEGISSDLHVPVYLRKSQAERERDSAKIG